MLNLNDVTLCAITSVNVDATIYALKKSMSSVDFGDVIFITDKELISSIDGIRIIKIENIKSGFDYSFFILKNISHLIETKHCLIVQWDGFVLSADHWDDIFLSYDYIGAPWPQFADRNVGNGGFSLRSHRLMAACQDRLFKLGHPEDVTICRDNRDFLENLGMRFPDASVASRFSVERSGACGESFGFHGAFNLIDAVGADVFWDIYKSLDDRTNIWHDIRLIMSQLIARKSGFRRCLRMVYDRIRDMI